MTPMRRRRLESVSNEWIPAADPRSRSWRRLSIPLLGLALMLAASTDAITVADDGFVGPDWVEDDDAGDTLETASKVKGNGNNVNTINGVISGGGGFFGGGTAGDFQDIFLIFIRNPESFSASTVAPGGQAAFDTRLWLFRLDGRGLLAADDAGPDVLQTNLKGFANKGNFGIPGPGVYGLAIGGDPTSPIAGKNLQMFAPPPPGATIGPTKAGSTLPLGAWIPPAGATGSYRIALAGVTFIPPPCGEGGDCFTPRATPGCDDLDCCSRVCDLDPACCDTAWDFQCTSIAKVFCQGCGHPNTGSCFASHPQPFCNDAECCQTVCSIDPGCCQIGWDVDCVTIATANCSPECSDLCPGDFNLDHVRNGADLGLLLGAWGDPGCTDLDGSGLTDGGDLGLLLGSLGPCRSCGDPAAGGCLSPHPASGCADAGCCEQVCEVDPACCSLGWDDGCADQARMICAPACGDPDSGPCNSTHLAPGCSNPQCCFRVCEYLPRCCTDSWDDACVEFANSLPDCSG